MVKQMVLGIIAVIVILLGVILWSVGDRAGAAAKGDRFDRMKASRAWNSKKNRFGNELKRVDGSFWEMGLKFFFGGSKHRLPTEPIVSDGIDESKFGTQPASGLRITWFGHSSFWLKSTPCVFWSTLFGQNEHRPSRGRDRNVFTNRQLLLKRYRVSMWL